MGDEEKLSVSKAKSRIEDKPNKKENKVQKPVVKMVSIMFKENRKFDLHIGREMITFRGREIKQIPSEWLLHRDFLQAVDYFIIKGV